MRTSQILRNRALEATKQKLAVDQKKAQEDYDAYIASPEGQQYLKYQEYQKSLAQAKEEQKKLAAQLEAGGYTKQVNEDNTVVYLAPEETRTNKFHEEMSFSPIRYVFKDNVLQSEERVQGSSYKGSLFTATTYLKTLTDKENYVYNEKRWDLEGYSTKLRSETTIDIMGNIYAKDMFMPRDYDNKYQEALRAIQNPGNFTPQQLRELQPTINEKLAKQNNLTVTQVARARSMTEQAQVNEYGKVIIKTTPGVPNTNYFMLQNKNKVPISKRQYETIEKSNKAIELQNKETKIDTPLTRTDSSQKVDAIFKPLTAYNGLAIIPEELYNTKEKTSIFQNVQTFLSQPSDKRAEQTINFMETNIQKGVNFIFESQPKTSLPYGIWEQVVKKQNQIAEGGELPKENYNLQGLGSIGANTVYNIVSTVAQTPTTVLKVLNFVENKNNKQKQEIITKTVSDTKEAIIKEPLTTTATVVGTYFAFKGINRLVSGKSSKEIKAQNIAAKAENKVINDLEVKGDVYYNSETDTYTQLRRVNVAGGANKLEPATLYVTETPKQTYTVAEGKNFFSVTTPEGYQYSTMNYNERGLFGNKNYLVKMETNPTGVTTTKVLVNDKIIGSFKDTTPSVFSFTDPGNTVLQKQYISAEDYRIDAKLKTQTADLVKTGESKINAKGELQTTTGTLLETTTKDQAQLTKGKIGIDLNTGKTTLEPNYIEITPTRYKYTTSFIEKKPTEVSKLATGEFLIDKEATAVTTQITKPDTSFKIIFNSEQNSLPPPSNIIAKKVVKPFEWLGVNKEAETPTISSPDTGTITKTIGKTKTQMIQKPAEPIVSTDVKLFIPTTTEVNEVPNMAILGVKTTQKAEQNIQQVSQQGFVSQKGFSIVSVVKQNPISIIKQNQVQENIQQQRQFQNQRQSQNYIQEQKQVQEQQQEQVQQQQQIQIQVQEQATQRTGTKLDIIKRIPEQATPVKPFLVNKPNRKQKGLYQVQVRRQGTFRTIAVTQDSEAAFNIGRTNVRNTAAASFRVISVGTQEKKEPGNQFYESKKEPGIFIQKNRFRISTAGEKREITAVGIMTNRSRKRRKGFLW